MEVWYFPSGVLRNDSDLEGDALTARTVIPTRHGRLVMNRSGSFTYKPAANYFGRDTFAYEARDGEEGDVAIVTITVRSASR